MSLKILTYNIHGMPWANTDMKRVFTWVLRDSEADIVCLQELWSIEHRKLLQDYLSVYGWKCLFPRDSCWIGSLLKGLDCGSGLAILYRPHVEILSTPHFEVYPEAAGVDKFITKGFYATQIKWKGILFTLVNTHFQSDFTELPCCRISYKFSRRFQEFHLYNYCKQQRTPTLIVGDFNQQHCDFLQMLEKSRHITFSETGEHLDHICTLKEETTFKLLSSTYFDTIQYSDHIPVRFTIDII
jgi:exonuclease III